MSYKLIECQFYFTHCHVISKNLDGPALKPTEHPNVEALRQFSVDGRRQLIQAERHARPPLPALAPAIVQHLVFHNDLEGLVDERRACLNICTALGLIPKGELNDQIQAMSDNLSLKWERHTEYSSYTLIGQNVGDAKSFTLWTEQDIGWKHVPGHLLVSLFIGVESEENPIWSDSAHFRFEEMPPLCSSKVMSGTTVIESDMRIGPQGQTRFLVRTQNEEPTRIGRLLQRLIEIESYGALSLLAWKDAKDIGPVLGEAESRLGDITRRLTAIGDEADEAILSDLTELSAFHEASTARTHFRLNASLAYHEIVVRRLSELREERISESQRLANFIQRRLNPAARTYKAILVRQEETAERINRAAQLLRGRIEVAIGKQNQQLLKSMNERAEAQYKLQRTVEGLSVVAITYYALGILTYLAAAIAGQFEWLSVKETVGFSVPFVLLTVWLGIQRLRK